MKQSEQQPVLLNKLSFLKQPYFSVLKYPKAFSVAGGGGGGGGEGRTNLKSLDSESQNLSYPFKVIVALNFLQKCSVPES